MRKTYPTDLSDTEWTRLQSYLPTPKAQGRPRTHSLRDVLDAIFYVLKSGCHWRLLPHDFPPRSTVYYHFRRFRSKGLWSVILKVLHAAQREAATSLSFSSYHLQSLGAAVGQQGAKLQLNWFCTLEATPSKTPTATTSSSTSHPKASPPNAGAFHSKHANPAQTRKAPYPLFR